MIAGMRGQVSEQECEYRKPFITGGLRGEHGFTERPETWWDATPARGRIDHD